MRRISSIAVVVVLISVFAIFVRRHATQRNHPDVEHVDGNDVNPANRRSRGSSFRRPDHDYRRLSDSSGAPLASAEFFNPDGTFSAAPPMSAARTGQAAIWMPTGEMLVAGGTTTGGGVTNSAEAFNPQANTWRTLSATMVRRAHRPHNGAVAERRCADRGRPELTPAQSPRSSYFPRKRSNSHLPLALATARTNAAAAVLSDGRVFIVGGTGANGATLASSEIYDPANPGATTAGPALKTPRSGASATTLLHGNVLIAGGSYPEGAQNGAAELASAEIFNPVAGTIRAARSAMSAARTGQLAFLLPSNNNVLLVGGTSNGQPLASTELYTPWKGQFQAHRSPMASARAGAVGSAMNSASYGAAYTVSGIDGLLLVAGGSNLSSAELYGFATIRTNAGDYAPGTPVIMTGSGWKPGEKVTIYLHEDPQVEANPVLTTTVDANGNINDSAYAPNIKDLGIRYYMTAVGSASGLQAQTTFTDGTHSNTTTVTLQSGSNPSTYGASLTFRASTTAVGETVSVSFYNQASGATCSSLGSSTLLGTAALNGSFSNNYAQVTTTTLAVGSTRSFAPATPAIVIMQQAAAPSRKR